MSDNPYESPADIESAEQAGDDSNDAIVASFVLDRAGIYRAVHYATARTRRFEQPFFLLSTVLLVCLLCATLVDAPRPWEVAIAVTFLAVHFLQILLPHVWTKLRLSRLLRESPNLLGHHEVRLDDGQLSTTFARGRSWPVRDLESVYYLGDLLLICPEPNLFVPVPRKADFGERSFYAFCERFAVEA
ncbi:MAG: hypothetical protein QGG36_28325 [Pirellulaceae bacterium]|jgi:hypothetical protein|nr:hypothetical protein [Pirellulaceae bacterium]MDP7019737.1 hypothetical protein [Pirellulaceae bacterium]